MHVRTIPDWSHSTLVVLVIKTYRTCQEKERNEEILCNNGLHPHLGAAISPKPTGNLTTLNKHMSGLYFTFMIDFDNV